MLAKDLKTGAILELNGAPVLIENIAVQTPAARGAATLYKCRGRNLITRQKVDVTFRGQDPVQLADFQRRPVTFLYRDARSFHFMDQTDYTTYEVDRERLEQEASFISESVEGMLALIFNEQCVGIQLPTAVVLAVTQCDPAARGNSATARTKPATLETGRVIQVPEYIKEGDRVKVDTRTGAFLGRA